MASNREISGLFGLYAELLLLHRKNERFATLLSGAACRIKNFNEPVIQLSKAQQTSLYRPDFRCNNELKNNGTIVVLDEFIQLTPPGY